MRKPVGIHYRNQSCIMRLLSCHSILHDEPVPLGKELPRLGQKTKPIQQPGNLNFGGFNGPPKTVNIHWPSCDDPEFQR